MRKLPGLLLLLSIPFRLEATSAARTVLVFPFENQSHRPDLNWMSEGFAEILSTRLGVGSCYTLGRTERERAFEQLGFPADAPLTLASQFKVAETLGVDWAVVGSFRAEGGRLTARTRLFDLHALGLSPPLEASGELADLADLSTQLGWRILLTHDSQFTFRGEEDFRRRFAGIRLDAFENYIRGVLSTDGQARVRFWRQADHLDPADHRAAFALGRFYFDQKDYAKSAEWLRKLEAKDRNYLESLFLLGVDEFFLNRPSAAEKAFAAVAREIPLDETANNLGVMKARRGLYAEALPSFERAYQGDSTDRDFAFNLAACLWYLQQYGEAAKILEETVRESSDDAETHSFLAATFGKLGDAARESQELAWLAHHAAAEVTSGEPGAPGDTARDFVPQLRLKKNYSGRAFQILALTVKRATEEALAQEPPDRHAAFHLEQGKRFSSEGRWPEAEDQFTEAIALLPGDSQAHLALAQVYEAQGRHQEASGELAVSIRLKPSATAHLLLARIGLEAGRLEEARSHLEAVLALEPRNREAAQLMEQALHSPSHPVATSRKTR